LDKQIADAQHEARQSAIAKVRALMEEHGLTAADLAARNTRSAGKAGKSGGKVPPKYRNKVTGETWSGRGLQPRWLKAELASGKKLSDFAV
jgi:DNA-binding protein H-NS